MKTTIKELQSKGYKKTAIKGLFLRNNGKAYNHTTKREINPTTKGMIVFNGKYYNLSKLILATFKKIPVRNGQILFLNGNNRDFYFENLEYATGTHYSAPSEASLINCIRLYFEVQKDLTRHDILFKDYLNQIAQLRAFVYAHKCNEIDLFLDWLKPFLQSESKAEISKKHGYTVRNGTNIINKYLAMLVNECIQDQKNELLTIKDFATKPLTATQKIKLTNEALKKLGFTSKIPLRKKPKTT
jgi:hypothetical protein